MLNSKAVIGIPLVLIVLMVSSSLFAPSTIYRPINERDTNTSSETVVHDPIRIVSNGDFVSLGLDGNGTLDDPYLIEDLHIATDNETPCIDIRNVDVYYKVVGCELIGIEGSLRVIDLRSSPYVKFEGNTVNSTHTGLYVNTDVEGILVDGCVFYTEQGDAIYAKNPSSDYEFNVNSSSFHRTSTNPQGQEIVIEGNNVTILGCETVGVSMSIGGNNLRVNDCDISETLQNNTSHVNPDYGVGLLWGSDFQIFDNNFYRCEDALWIRPDALNGQAHNNIVNDCQRGIITNGNSTQLSNNTIDVCFQGISVYSGTNNTILSNKISACTAAIEVDISNYTQVSNNTLQDCSLGIYVTEQSLMTQIFYNRFLNISSELGIQYGFVDDGIQTLWDDNSSLGNYWDRYFTVNDRWPVYLDTEIPIIDPINPITIILGENTTITFNATDNTPFSYSIFVDDILYTEGDWNGSLVIITFSLSSGEHEVKSVFTDINGNSASYTISVYVDEPSTISPDVILTVAIMTVGIVVLFVISIKRRRW